MCFYYLSCQPVQDVLNDMAINFIFLRFFSYHTAVVDPGEGPRTPLFWVKKKKKKIIEGRKTSRASDKKNWVLPLAQGLDLPLLCSAFNKI